VIVELPGEGRDTLYANYNVFALAANLEQLVSFGRALVGIGNALDNTLYGNNNSSGMFLIGDAGADLIFGSNFDDNITGGMGNDTLVGLGGADVFVYDEALAGADVIADFTDTVDRISLNTMGYTSGLSGITITGGANALITFTGGALIGTTITLTGVAAANVTAADFIF
jgi:serralysin